MIKIYDVLKSVRDKATNLIYGSVGDSSNDGESELDGVHMDFFPYGFCSIPPDAEGAEAVETLVYSDAGKSLKVSLGTRSAKMLETLGKMLPGQLMLYAFGNKIIIKKRGISLMGEDDNGEMTFHLELLAADGGSAKLSFPYGYGIVDKSGIRVRHGSINIMAGQIGGIDPNVKNYVRITADSISLNGQTYLGATTSGIYAPATCAILPVMPGSPVPNVLGVPNVLESTVMIATGL